MRPGRYVKGPYPVLCYLSAWRIRRLQRLQAATITGLAEGIA